MLITDDLDQSFDLFTKIQSVHFWVVHYKQVKQRQIQFSVPHC